MNLWLPKEKSESSNPWARRADTPLETATASGNMWSARRRGANTNPWARRGNRNDSDTDDNADATPLPIVPLQNPTQRINDQIQMLATTNKLTLAMVGETCNVLATQLRAAKSNSEVGGLCVQVDTMFKTLAKREDSMKHLTAAMEGQAVRQYVVSMIEKEPGKDAKVMMSRSAEQAQRNIKHTAQTSKREMLAAASVIIQRVAADAFLHLMCDKTASVGGVSEVLYEKHRGDETPFAKCKAQDDCFIGAAENEKPADAPIAVEDNAPDILALPAASTNTLAEPSIIAHSVAVKLKVYQTDLEVAALFTYPSSQPVLVSSKLYCPWGG